LYIFFELYKPFWLGINLTSINSFKKIHNIIIKISKKFKDLKTS